MIGKLSLVVVALFLVASSLAAVKLGAPGITLQDGSGTCFSQGDVHYKSLDNKGYHHQCACKYILTQPKYIPRTKPKYVLRTQFEYLLRPKRCDFKVLSKNWYRPGDTRQDWSWTKYVEVHLGGMVVRLGQNKEVTIYIGRYKFKLTSSFTFWGRCGPIRITAANQKCVSPDLIRRVAFETKLACWTQRFISVDVPNIGLLVRFDGYADARVTLNKYWMNKVEGLCQNFDGDSSNDLTTRGGVDVSGQPNPGTLVGNSFMVFDPEERHCRPCKKPDMPWMVWRGALDGNIMFAKFAEGAKAAESECDLAVLCPGKDDEFFDDFGGKEYFEESCKTDVMADPANKCQTEKGYAEDCGNTINCDA